MTTNFEPVSMAQINPMVEVLFTSEWSAIYDPASRERWELTALLDKATFHVLNGEGDATPEVLAARRDAGLVEPESVSGNAARAWCEAGWQDPLRHYLHTNLLPKLSYADREGWLEDFSTMRSKVEDSPVPPLTKSYSKELKVIDLPAHAACDDHTSLTLAVLGHLLIHTFGVVGEKRLAVTGRHVLRTSPSGGSRHPTEAYVVAFDVEGLPAGVYHFDSAKKSLTQMRDGQYSAVYMAEIAGLNRRIGFTPRAAIVLTSVVERSMHRYRDSRSYRVLHFDLGHLLRTLQMLAGASRLAYFSAYSLGDTPAEHLLGIDGLMESAMCQFILG